MIIFRFQDDQGKGPAYESGARPRMCHCVKSVEVLFRNIVFNRASAFSLGIERHEVCALTLQQFENACCEVDGDEFLMPETLRVLSVPDDAVRVVHDQAFVLRKETVR